MRAGLDRGFTVPRVTLKGRDIGVAQVVDAGAGEEQPFYEPFKTMPATMTPATAAALRAEAKAAIRDDVLPAHRRLLTFLRQDYMPRAQVSTAAYDLPDGKAYYRSKIREYVTADMTPEQVHAIGLSEMQRIRTRMDQVMKEVKFQGDFPAFLTFLRTDPQFYAKTPQELLDRAAWFAKSFDGVASQWFGRLPRSRFAIKPVPADLAPFYTGGRGGPGIYLVNTYNLPSRPLYSLPALTLHESAPGHAFQMPLAAENKDLARFRRDSYLSAYGEGWALYCEALGEDMGIYKTPYERFGMLSYQAGARRGWSWIPAFMRWDGAASRPRPISTTIRRCRITRSRRRWTATSHGRGRRCPIIWGSWPSNAPAPRPRRRWGRSSTSGPGTMRCCNSAMCHCR